MEQEKKQYAVARLCIGALATLGLSACGAHHTVQNSNAASSGGSVSSSGATLPIALSSVGNGNYVDVSSGELITAIGNGEYVTSDGQLIIPFGNNDYLNTATGQMDIQVGPGEYMNSSTGQMIYVEGGSLGASRPTAIKDVDLQRAEEKDADLRSRAKGVADQFGMSLQSAVEVTVLADRLRALTSGGRQMTAQDMAALLDSAYHVAGVSAQDVAAAAQRMIQTGDQTGVDQLLNQAAAHMGMSSTAALRDEILPSIGIRLGQ